MIFSKRVAAQREAAARARGESVDYITREVPPEFRMKLWYALTDLLTSKDSPAFGTLSRDVTALFRARLLRDYGLPTLSGNSSSASQDLAVWVTSTANAEQLMDIVEYGPFIAQLITVESGDSYRPARPDAFFGTISAALSEHKLAWAIVEGKVVEVDSAVMHAEVVAPALTLLHGRQRFAAVERQYREALDELANRNWGDAITDANAAVEVTLRTLLCFEEGQLPALLAEARRRGLFGEEEDRRLRKFVDGFTALSDMRNKEGDAHGNTSTKDSAWLAVHWAGSLIVFIVERAEALGM